MTLSTIVITPNAPQRESRLQPQHEKRIGLSTPHMSGQELRYIQEAFDSNWIAPVGPHLDTFEREFTELLGVDHAVAMSSGTAALHMALLLAGVGRDDDVMVSTFTFAASVNPITYLGGRPIFIDSERESWNMDPGLLAEALETKSRQGRLPKAVVLVHILGQGADIVPIRDVCRRFDVALVEDAAEALGTTYYDHSPPGTIGQSGIFSFNGNKIITTSGGGMLVTDDANLAQHARKLSTQAREPVPHYQHNEVGYNYRLSNVLAGVGRAQLNVLEDRVTARRRNFSFYESNLSDLPGICFQPEAPWGRHTRWLTAMTIDPALFGCDREFLRQSLEARNIETRAVWKPMHQQPVFAGCDVVGGSVSEELFEKGLCLPSGSNLTEGDLSRVMAATRDCYPAG